jgi:lysophospholipase L1-like esterase
MRLRRFLLVAAVWAVGTANLLRAGVLDGDGIGAMGDSMTMQYSQWVQLAALYGMDIHYDGKQYNWVDHLVMSGYNFGPSLPLFGIPTLPPANEYNVGVVGISSTNLLYLSDLMKPFVADDRVKSVVINIGANDFGNGPYYDDFYNRSAIPGYDPLTDPDSAEVIGTILGNIQTSVNNLLASNPNTRFVLHTVPDLGVTPEYQADHADPARRAIVSTVFDALNQQIIDLAATLGAPVVDLNGLAALLASEPEIAGIPLLYSGGTTGNHAFLSDSFHPGTVMQGYMANLVLLAHHIAWGDDIELISDQEIVTRAGLTPVIPGPTYVDLSNYVIWTVPEPSSVVLAVLGGCGFLALSRRRRAA